MPYTLIQGEQDLHFIDTDGNVDVLDLPENITIDDTVKPRFAVYGDVVVVVNSPSVPLVVDAHGTVRPLTPKAPQTGPILSAGDVGTLSGTYLSRYSFIVRDTEGEMVAESDWGPVSNSLLIASKYLRVSGLELSADTISARRLYRTTTAGSTWFPWLDVDGNTITTIQDDLSDAGLSLIAAPTLGNPPHLTLICEWRNRLWGVGDLDPDTLRFAQADAYWAWPVTNSIVIPGKGRDKFGVRALMPRREALGVGRRDLIWQITGNTPADFRAVKLSTLTGVESHETVCVYKDTVWWLWKDGVYQWDAEGMFNITDKKVKSWFTSNSFFNRDEFVNAFAVFDPIRIKYRLFLASAGQSTIDRWVEYDPTTKTWWGPHRTDAAITPSCAFVLVDAEDKGESVIGSDEAFIWQDQDTATDDIQDGIATSLLTKYHDANLPDIEKYWGELSVLGKVQEAGTIDVTPTVGYLDTPPQTPLAYDMTKGRHRLPRLGTGQLMQLELTHDTPDEPVELYGFETSVAAMGRR